MDWRMREAEAVIYRAALGFLTGLALVVYLITGAAAHAGIFALFAATLLICLAKRR